MKMKKIERISGNEILFISEDGTYTESKSMEANILFEILNKLEEIRCGIIDVEMSADGIRSKLEER